MSGFNKELMERALKWAQTEHEAKVRGEPSAWFQRHWTFGLLGTGRRHRAPLGEGSVRWLPMLWAASRGDATWEEMQAGCNTAFCVAGHVAAISGDVFVRAVHDEGLSTSDYVLTPDGVVEAVSEHARQLLGISSREAEQLFSPDNSLDDVRTVARRIATGYGEELDLD